MTSTADYAFDIDVATRFLQPREGDTDRTRTPPTWMSFQQVGQ